MIFLVRASLFGSGLAALMGLLILIPTLQISTSPFDIMEVGPTNVEFCSTAMRKIDVSAMLVRSEHVEAQANSQALAPIIEALRCFPSDGALWTTFAMFTLASDGPTHLFQQAYNHSELTAASEAWAIKQRLRMLIALDGIYPGLLNPALDRYLERALHRDISLLLATMTTDQQAKVLARMRVINTAQIRRWFQGHNDNQ